ncbi:MAG TPA: hypothetical protein VGW38_06830 [Chloroflexota bacterium]|nr:hypothetical protein [Chloroflexota bacterium]
MRRRRATVPMARRVLAGVAAVTFLNTVPYVALWLAGFPVTDDSSSYLTGALALATAFALLLLGLRALFRRVMSRRPLVSSRIAASTLLVASILWLPVQPGRPKAAGAYSVLLLIAAAIVWWAWTLLRRERP